MSNWTAFEMSEWADLIDETRRLRDQPPRPWSLTCHRGGCHGYMFRNACMSCGDRR